jgi:Fructose-1-6-bisphosphatase, N-terminal domain
MYLLTPSCMLFTACVCIYMYISALPSSSSFLPNIHRGDYAGVFDPLDGSSNIEAGLPVGTIFGIYRRPTLSLSSNPDPLEAIMQPGARLLASGRGLSVSYLLTSSYLPTYLPTYTYMHFFHMLPSYNQSHTYIIIIIIIIIILSPDVGIYMMIYIHPST